MERVIVVDRDPGCAAGGIRDPRLRLEVAEWSEWLDAGLDRVGPGAHLVPYHWAPHLLLGWLEGQLRRAGAATARGGPAAPRGLPFDAATARGDRALSYAAWACPPACIEPALCPHTRGPRDWSLAADLEAPGPDAETHGHVVFRCLHLLYGVGTIPVAAILEARDRLRAGLARGRQRYRIATSSHCHGLATLLEVAPAAAADAGGGTLAG